MLKKIFWSCFTVTLFFYLLFVRHLSSSLGAPQHGYSIYDFLEGGVFALLTSTIIVLLTLLIRRLTR